MMFEKRDRFIVIDCGQHGQPAQQRELFLSTLETPAGELANHQLVSLDVPALEQAGDFAVAPMKVLEPDRCVEDHRRGMLSTASRRALGHPAPWNRAQMRLRPTERRQTFGGRALNQQLQALANQRGLFAYARQSSGLFEQLIIDVERRPHMY